MPQLAIDKTVSLAINGSQQQIRMCAERGGLPPLLIVQAGPSLPILHEVSKFQRLLHLELDFLVGYWEQRGSGTAPQQDAKSLSIRQQVDDLLAVLRWFNKETRQDVILFGISLGASIVLRAVEQANGCARSVIAISADLQTPRSDANAYEFLQQQSVRDGNRRLRESVMKLGRPPYVDSSSFQRRARLLADLDTIERGKTFASLLRETLFSMVGTYGVFGTVRTLRNLTLAQRALLPELSSFDLFANPPQIRVPVHYLFGAEDVLAPAAVIEQLPTAIPVPRSTVAVVPDAGHMLHFDQPDVVRAVAMKA